MSNLNNAHEGMDDMGDHLDAQQEKKAAAPQPVQTEEDERAAFEVWWNGDVTSERTKLTAWTAWQARAAIASKPVPLMANGLTEDETSATASVSGLSSRPAEADERAGVDLEAIYQAIVQWDEGGGKRSRRELARRIVRLHAYQEALSSRPVQGGEPVAWIRYEWNKSGAKSLAFEKPAELPLADEARGVVYEPLFAALSSAPAREQWQPIETAPKDGRKLLLTYKNSSGLPRIVVGGWVTDEEAAETDEDGVGLEAGWYERIDNWGDYYQVSINEGEPTHWMPLPAAPGATAEPAPAREPMTEREILDLVPTLMPIGSDFELLWFARAIERHHRICKE